jgi:hypothetical protein
MPVRCNAITIHRRQVMLLDPCWRSSTCSHALRCCMGRTEAVNAQYFKVCPNSSPAQHSALSGPQKHARQEVQVADAPAAPAWCAVVVAVTGVAKESHESTLETNTMQARCKTRKVMSHSAGGGWNIIHCRGRSSRTGGLAPPLCCLCAPRHQSPRRASMRGRVLSAPARAPPHARPPCINQRLLCTPPGRPHTCAKGQQTCLLLCVTAAKLDTPHI